MTKKYIFLGIIFLLLSGFYARKLLHKPLIPSLALLNPITITLADHPVKTSSSVGQLVESLQNYRFSNGQLTLGDQIYAAQQGIHILTTDKVVFITSRGYAYATQPRPQSMASSIIQFPRVGGGLICATNWIKYLKITAPVICFDYFDDWHNFDFGLTQDSKCLDLVIKEALKQNPSCEIVLIGTCKGSRSILHYLTHEPVKNIKSVILDAPFATVSDLSDVIHKHYFKWLPYGNFLLHSFLQWWFPNYNQSNDLPHHIEKLPKNLPILIGHLKNDLLVTDHQMKEFIKLFQNHENLHVCVISHPTIKHSKLSHITLFQQIANSFLAQYNLPHNTQLAHQADNLFPCTHYNATHPVSWITFKSS